MWPVGLRLGFRVGVRVRVTVRVRVRLGVDRSLGGEVPRANTSRTLHGSATLGPSQSRPKGMVCGDDLLLTYGARFGFGFGFGFGLGLGFAFGFGLGLGLGSGLASVTCV